MHLDGFFDRPHVRLGQYGKAGFVGCHDLIGHCLALLATDCDDGFAGIGSFRVAGHGYNPHPRQVPVCCVVARGAEISLIC
jgi:hypothetical protein